MASRKKSKEPLYEKLQILRSITNSHARKNNSILRDATRYIEELKQKVESLHQDVAQTSSDQNSCEPVVTVETLERGFFVNLYTDNKNSPGLLVSVLEAFEELGLNVVEFARISCTHSFHLENAGGLVNEESEETLSDQVVKQTILKAIQNWRESNNEQD